jgi:hypothetical protein
MAAFYDPAVYTREELEAELAHWKAQQKSALASHSSDGMSVTRISPAEIADRLRAVTEALRKIAPDTYGPPKKSCINLTF